MTALAVEALVPTLGSVLTSVVWTTDGQARFREPQAAWEAYTGQPFSRHRGLGWQAGVHPDDIEAVRAGWMRAREQRRLFRAEARFWHAESRAWRHCEIRAVPLTGADGRVSAWVGTCLDVEEHWIEEEALRGANQRKDEFMATLAHELRNPLAPIRNAVHVLKSCQPGDARAEWARGVIERQVEQMAQLLDDLLDVSRIPKGKLELRKGRIALGTVLERALETSRPLIEAQGHRLELDIPLQPIALEGDMARLSQVFANLLNNAAKYTDRGGRIEVSAWLEGKEAVVRVRDNGIGIDAATLPHVFEMYSQARPALPRAQGGLGIGLSLVQGVVRMHQGSIEARSDGLGLGSEFVVRLPALPGVVLPIPVRESLPVSASGMRILVADDNQDAAETLSMLLTMMGHEVRTATDGQQAVELAAEFAPSVALLDIGMPRLDGYEAARHIRTRLPDAMLIATTGHAQREDLRKSAAAGFDHHLVKPVNPDQVARLLAGLMGEAKR